MRGRRIVHRGDDLDEAVLLRDLQTDTAEAARGLDFHIRHFLGVHVARMRIERTDHAVDSAADKLRIADVADIFRFDALECFVEQPEPASAGPIRGGLRRGK